jgi:cobalt/nickel transport system permease protein
MSAGLIPISPLLAVHISDGVLAWPWLAGGFALAAVLVALAMYKVRDEEIPRIALMTAAFFVASLIHVPIGPTSVHLLLNGLLGVILGRRAPLAVLLGLMLQAVLLGHGGFTAIGVNTCIMALPALGAAWLFGVLRAGTRWSSIRFGLVVVGVVLWFECAIFSVALFWLSLSTSLNAIAWAGATAAVLNPVALTTAVLLGAVGALVERRLRHASEFPAGLLAGMAAVLATLALNAAVLLWGGAEDWHSIVLLLFVAHMPIIAVEGGVLGFAAAFLARVKPEMLGGVRVMPRQPAVVASNGCARAAPAGVTLPPSALLLLAVLGMLWAATPAHAHRLEADYRVRPDGQVQVESWFDLGGNAPAGARVQVFRPNGDVLAEGALDEQGIFVFAPQAVEDLRVVVSAGAGHRAELAISQFALPQGLPASAATTAGAAAPPTPMIDRTYQIPYKEILAGFGFLLGLAAFVLSLRNMRQLRELKRAQERGVQPGAPADDGHFSAGKTSSSGTSH